MLDLKGGIKFSSLVAGLCFFVRMQQPNHGSQFNPLHKHGIFLHNMNQHEITDVVSHSLKRVYKIQEGNKLTCCTPRNLVAIVEISDVLKLLAGTYLKKGI